MRALAALALAGLAAAPARAPAQTLQPAPVAAVSPSAAAVPSATPVPAPPIVHVTPIVLATPAGPAPAPPTAGATTAPPPASPAPGAVDALLRRLFASPQSARELFGAAFVARVPVSQVELLVRGYTARFGALRTVRDDADGSLLTFERGSLRATADLDAAGTFSLLRFHDEQSAADRAALERLIRAPRPSAAAFTQGFLAQASLAQVSALLADFRLRQGAYRGIASRGGRYFAQYARGESNVQISVAPDGRIAYLRFPAFAPYAR